jgi:hypothetical protein
MSLSWVTTPSGFATLGIICFVLSGQWRSALHRKTLREIFEHFRKFGAPQETLVQKIFGWLGIAFGIACMVTAFAPLFRS